jgi:hypothetical protein
VRTGISNISLTLGAQNRVARVDRCLLSALNLATLSGDKQAIFSVRHNRFVQLARIGRWADAQAIWDLLDPMGRDWSRALYRLGDAESAYAQFRFWQGDLGEEQLAHAEQLATRGMSRAVVRLLHGLRGEWRLERGEWALAAENLS